MHRTGQADLPLHGGRVPYWLASRMENLGGAIIEAMIQEYGIEIFFERISDPAWFQAFGCVLGMDWHSSGITTSVMAAVQRAFNRRQAHLGIKVLGGRGSASRKTPEQLIRYADRFGLDGNSLVRTSRLSAKVDNTAIQDGYQIYLHCFVIDRHGRWAVVQQGMNTNNGMARRYHWLYSHVTDYLRTPHSAIEGLPGNEIINLTDMNADSTKEGILALTGEQPYLLTSEIRKIIMPRRHEVNVSDTDLRRLGAVLASAWERQPEGFEDLLLTQGLGPRTLQSLVLVSEVIHGTPSRFQDPARFSFAHGGKDGHPFPVPTKIYDQSISFMDKAVRQARIGHTDKSAALRKLHEFTKSLEKRFIPEPSKFRNVIDYENEKSASWGGRTATGRAVNPQLRLF